MSIVFVLSIFSFTYAQKAPVVKTTTKTKVAKPAATVTTKTTVVTPAPAVKGMKKDGTPDMRFKENKEKKEGPKKKDGTPDMRYKSNKKK